MSRASGSCSQPASSRMASQQSRCGRGQLAAWRSASPWSRAAGCMLLVIGWRISDSRADQRRGGGNTKCRTEHKEQKRDGKPQSAAVQLEHDLTCNLQPASNCIPATNHPVHRSQRTECAQKKLPEAAGPRGAKDSVFFRERLVFFEAATSFLAGVTLRGPQSCVG